jgi:peptide/nickel transport system substrate-binding protein
MQAVAGSDRDAWRDAVGYFSPRTPMANDVGMVALRTPRDYKHVREEIRRAGYRDEKVSVLIPSDFTNYNALALVAAGIGKKRPQRRRPDHRLGGRSAATNEQNRSRGGRMGVFCTSFAGVDIATNLPPRGGGADAWFGWPDAPEIEALRDRWFAAPDLTSQQGIAREIQAQAFIDVPYLPLGQYFQQSAQRSTLTGTLEGIPIFWNVQRT